jgi:hypothetical protein
MWMEQEWRNYYCRRQKPRVSYQIADSGLRATRWLQVPYWATAVLMAINTTLHWLVSQTMFVFQIFGSEITDSKFYINHSPLAMMSIIGVASSILVLGITIYYFVPRTSSMPLRVVSESCKELSWPFPRSGMHGEIFQQRENIGQDLRKIPRR